ncbi:MAG TPA: glycosyltransferase family 2 protein [Asticcacaulis sp.]|nr:glycosyltransferase family 2 protein [Asticcacaulis sp.]
MKASVIIRSKDEADRLRLTLTSLAYQSETPEVVVVNDGSSDHTRQVIAEAEMPVVTVHNARAIGRSAASNAGAAAASGDVVLFLDGDTLACPTLVAQHMALHREQTKRMVRGSTYHLRCTRPFLDPESGTPQADQVQRVAKMSPNELKRNTVTRQQIRDAFHEVDARGQPGVYPGFGPRKLFELEMGALTDALDCPVLWAASSGANFSLERKAFLEAGGFLAVIDNNEHRELALRLCNLGFSMAGTPARTYHMTHRSGWRDPLIENDWEAIFFEAHPTPEVALLPVLWASLADTPDVPEKARILSLPQLAEAAARCRGIEGREAVRAAHLRWAETGSV